MSSASPDAAAPSVFGLIAAALVAVGATGARSDEPLYYAPGGIALSGYDVVAYFTVARPVAGDVENALVWRGATWLFASPQTLMAFEMNPEAYAPQFGGYCAYSVAEGHTAASAPDAFFIVDGRLYFLHEAGMLRSLEPRLAAIIADAEHNWPDARKN